MSAGPLRITTLIACGLLVFVTLGVIVGRSWAQSSGEHSATSFAAAQDCDVLAHGCAPRSLQEPSYLYEGKAEPAWVVLGTACGLRDPHGRQIMFAADTQLPTPTAQPVSDGPAPTESLAGISCAQLTRWAAGLIASGKAKAFAVTAPEYQAWCSEDEVIHHTCR